jgi:FtsH-binding integral membrane protein
MKKIFLVYFCISLLLIPLSSFAQQDEGLVPCGPGTSKPVCTLCDLFVMISRIVNFILFRIVPALAALMIALGGIMYVIAFVSPSGGPEMLNKAKSVLKAVFFGLLIAYGAWLIVNTFFWAIGVNEWTGLRNNWWQINCD